MTELPSMTEAATRSVPGYNDEEFERDGFCRLPGIVPDELVSRFEDEIDALAQGQMACRGIEPNGRQEPLAQLFQLGGAYRSLLYQAVHQLPAIAGISQHVFGTLRDGGVLDRLGFEAPLLTQGIRVDIPGEDQFLLPMHQDYAHLWAPRCVRIWLPLRPVGPGIGSMSVVPGSHARGYVPHNMSDPKYPFLDADTYDPADEVIMEMDAGDAILFSPFLFHGSQANRGERIKFVMAVHIQDGGVLVDPADKDDPVVQMMDVHKQRSAARGTG